LTTFSRISSSYLYLGFSAGFHLPRLEIKSCE
jgi:hypothetical protein